jgi:uncharacterized PurR-regulated membrane protein YhhQ (DUF165 family)
MLADLQAEYTSHVKQRRLAWGFSFAYLLMIVAVNVGFAYLPVIHTLLGPVPLMAFFVGLVFILRDYAQRYAGHNVLIVMWLGLGLSVVLADPMIAFASGLAFIVSELADWGVYTVTKKPFQHRVLISSAIAVPLDSLCFLWGIGMASWGGILAMSLSKFAASLLLYSVYHTMEASNDR